MDKKTDRMRELEVFIINKDWDTFAMDESDPLKYNDEFIEAGSWESRTLLVSIPESWLDIGNGWAFKDKEYAEGYVRKHLIMNGNLNETNENYYLTYLRK